MDSTATRPDRRRRMTLRERREQQQNRQDAFHAQRLAEAATPEDQLHAAFCMLSAALGRSEIEPARTAAAEAAGTLVRITERLNAQVRRGSSARG